MLRAVSRNVAYAAGFLLTVIPGIVVAQTGRLAGTVMRDSSGTALASAEVTLPDLKRSTTSNYRGEFSLSGLPAGRHAVVIRRLGFAPLIDTVAIQAGSTVDREFVLLETAVQLDSVRVAAPERKYISPHLQEFDERRKLGFGHFITEEELRKEDNRSFVNVIASRVPGIRVFRPDPRNPSSEYLGSTRKCGDGPAILSCKGGGSYCPVTMYIDGVVVFNGATEKERAFIPDLGKYATNQYAGVEFYAGAATIPPKYNMTGSGCGVLLLWTRER